MREEVFGPILPVLEIDSVQGAIDWASRNPHPLGLYVFAEDNDVVDRILSRQAAPVMAPALDGRQPLFQVLLAVVRPACGSAESSGCPGG